MQLDPIHAAESARFLEAQLENVSARLLASRARPLDRTVIAELTALRFASTRLSRQLRLLSLMKNAEREVHFLDPARELVTVLNDARAEAARRGALISFRLRDLERISRKINFINSLASLVEDGIDAGANYLSLQTRHSGDDIELCLTTDAQLHRTSVGMLVLSSPLPSALSFSVRVEQTKLGLTRISVASHADRQDARHNHAAKRWTSPSPSSI